MNTLIRSGWWSAVLLYCTVCVAAGSVESRILASLRKVHGTAPVTLTDKPLFYTRGSTYCGNYLFNSSEPRQYAYRLNEKTGDAVGELLSRPKETCAQLADEQAERSLADMQGLLDKEIDKSKRRIEALEAAVAAQEKKVRRLEENPWREGTHYSVLEPALATRADDSKVEVLFACSYVHRECMELEKQLPAWIMSLPPHIQVRREYAAGSLIDQKALAHAALFYTLESLRRSDLHLDVLGDLIDGGHLLHGADRARTLQLQRSYAESEGIDPQQYDKHFDSFAVQAAVQRFQAGWRSPLSSSVYPIVVVDGMYLARASNVGGVRPVFDLVDFLVFKARQK